jgi:hypothetical protein
MCKGETGGGGRWVVGVVGRVSRGSSGLSRGLVCGRVLCSKGLFMSSFFWSNATKEL